MTDDIGVNVFREIKPNSKPARIGVRVVIGYHRNAGGVRKTDCDRGRFPEYVRCPGQRRGIVSRCERPLEHGPLGMGWPKARVQSENSIKLLKYILAQRNNLIVRGK